MKRVPRSQLAEGVGLKPTSRFRQRFSSLKLAFSALSRYLLKSVRDLGKRWSPVNTRRDPKTPLFDPHTAKYGQNSAAKVPRFNYGTAPSQGNSNRSQSAPDSMRFYSPAQLFESLTSRFLYLARLTNTRAPSTTSRTNAARTAMTSSGWIDHTKPAG